MATKTVLCAITKKPFPADDLIPLSAIRPKVANLILQHHPELTATSLISHPALNQFRAEYVRQVLEEDIGEISHLEADVLRSLQEHEILADNIDKELDSHSTFGQRLSDTIASFGGSWTFIIGFGVFLLLWVVVNIVLFSAGKAPDPYPFIFLNLILSCVAALQAPVIMMSQNRQETKDRARGENDYKINLKAELEIRHLHEKIDFLLKQQSQRLYEIQQIQLEQIGELVTKTNPKRRPPPAKPRPAPRSGKTSPTGKKSRSTLT